MTGDNCSIIRLYQLKYRRSEPHLKIALQRYLSHRSSLVLNLIMMIIEFFKLFNIFINISNPFRLQRLGHVKANTNPIVVVPSFVLPSSLRLFCSSVSPAVTIDCFSLTLIFLLALGTVHTYILC
jgi:hypothetical protein